MRRAMVMMVLGVFAMGSVCGGDRRVVGGPPMPTLTPTSVEANVMAEFTLTWTLNSGSSPLDVTNVTETELRWNEAPTDANSVIVSTDEDLDASGVAKFVDGGLGSSYEFTFTCQKAGNANITFSWTIPYAEEVLASGEEPIDERPTIGSAVTSVTCAGSATDGGVDNDAMQYAFSSGEGLALLGTGFAVKAASGTVVVVDRGASAVVSIDPVGKVLAVASDATVGSGPALDKPVDLDEIDSDTVLVADSGLDALITVDLATGARTILSDASTGTGPVLTGVLDVVVDAANNRAFVLDAPFGGDTAVVEVNLANGNRTIVSNSSTGIGDPISGTGANGISYDSVGNRILVLEFTKLISIAVGTGNRTVISDSGTGSGPDFSVPVGVVADGANDRALVVDRDLDTLFWVSLINGNRTVLSNASTGAGTDFERPTDAVLDISGNRALVIDSLLNAVVEVDLTSGDRTIYAM